MSEITRVVVPATTIIMAALLLIMPAGVSAEPATERYIVSFQPGVRMEASGGVALRVERRLPLHHAIAARLTPDEAARISRDPGVVRVEPDPRRYPVSAMRARPSGQDLRPAGTTGSTQIVPYGIHAVRAAGLPGFPAAGIKTCVIDSGYDLGHEDLPLKPTVNGESDPLGAGLWTQDPSGHGTHVAGTISARNNAVGVLGVFPRAPIHVVKVFDGNDQWAYSSDLIHALDRCMAAGARVINMSLGGSEASAAEQIAFRNARTAGVIAIAAAGNDGSAMLSYPASYPSVISVAAVDENLQRADFSNYNTRVLLAAPGVSVLSTVPRGSTLKAELTTGLGTQEVIPMDNFPTPTDPVSGRLVDCGLAGKAADCVGGATGAICLIERGEFFFNEKAQACEAAGGVGAIVYNRADEAGPVYGTLGDTQVGIPIVGTDRGTGLSLKQFWLGTDATLAFRNWAYDYFSGTSMATPHVAGVTALVWSRHPKCSSETVRLALLATAQDLGTPGRDPDYGAGLVRARQANAWLARQPCSAL